MTAALPALFSLVALLLVPSLAGGAAAPYFPYDTIEKYYQAPPGEPPLAQPPANRQHPEPLPPPQPEPARRQGPPAIGSPPEFLFPGQLGFGVAVGVPYDLMYLDKEYYLWQEGYWYRSRSYRGPWAQVSYAQLPPELRKQSLGKIRSARNNEFKIYWNDRDGYQGRRFRPGGESKEEGSSEVK